MLRSQVKRFFKFYVQNGCFFINASVEKGAKFNKIFTKYNNKKTGHLRLSPLLYTKYIRKNKKYYN